MQLAIIWHSRTGASQAMAQAAADGARQCGADLAVQLVRAADTTPDLLLASQGYLFVCPENLAAISGEMKEFFDRCYYPLLGKIEGRAYAQIIAAGSDGSNAARQVARIATGWRLRAFAEPLIICTHAQTAEEITAPKHMAAKPMQTCAELGAMAAHGLAMGVF